MIGSILDGKYEVLKQLGEGAMGAVFEAEHLATGRRCAIKVIHASVMTEDPQMMARFEREARAAGTLDSQYIAQVLDAGVDLDLELPFLALEFLDGEDVWDLLQRLGPFAPSLAARIASQACRGLHKAHQSDIVHRDIKPHNLYIARRDDDERVVKLLDFGIAKIHTDDAAQQASELTKTGSLLGSPLYMSPEQARGQRSIDHRTDLWSIGAVLYQILCGKAPFEDTETFAELILAVCSRPAPPLIEQAPGVPKELAAIVHRCLLQDPAKRFQSAKEMVDALDELLPGDYSIKEAMLVPSAEVDEATLPPLRSAEPEPGGALAETMAITAAALPATVDMAGAGEGGAKTVPGWAPREAAAVAVPKPSVEQPAAPGSQGGLKWALVALVALVVGAAAVFLLRSGGESQHPVATAATGTAVAERPPSEQDPGPSVVRVVILPADAQVEVEGKPVKLQDGLLVLDGPVGTVYKVRIFDETSEVSATVAVTHEGALPAKIEMKRGEKIRLTASPAAHSVARPAPSPRASAPAPPPPTKAAPPPTKKLKTSMDEFK